ncbi:hypothetical protein Bpfe_011452, partial [Biomphalaria pfeifferi]
SRFSYPVRQSTVKDKIPNGRQRLGQRVKFKIPIRLEVQVTGCVYIESIEETHLIELRRIVNECHR